MSEDEAVSTINPGIYAGLITGGGGKYSWLQSWTTLFLDCRKIGIVKAKVRAEPKVPGLKIPLWPWITPLKESAKKAI